MPDRVVAISPARFELLRMDDWSVRHPLGVTLSLEGARIPGVRPSNVTMPPGQCYVVTSRNEGRVWLVGARGRGENEVPLTDITHPLAALTPPARRAIRSALARPGKAHPLEPPAVKMLRAWSRGGGALRTAREVEPVVADVARLVQRLVARPLPPDPWEKHLGTPDPSPWRPGPRLDEPQLGAIEKELRVALAPGYRAWLELVGDGLPGRYGGIASIASRGAHTRKKFVLDRPWLPDRMGKWIADNDDEYTSRWKKLHWKLPKGARPEDGCLLLGHDAHHNAVWLVLKGPPKQRGTVWLDSTSTDYGHWAPTGKDFLTYVYELLHARVESMQPSEPLDLDELAPLEELEVYTSPRYAPVFYRRADPPFHARALFERVPAKRRQSAVQHLLAIAGQGLRGALEIHPDRIDVGIARAALAVFEHARAHDDRPEHPRIWVVSETRADPEMFAMATGDWEKAEAMARAFLADGRGYLDDHQVHVLIARAARGLPPDFSLSVADPNYDTRSQNIWRLLERQPLEVLERILEALPPETRLQWLASETTKIGTRLPNLAARVLAATEQTLARVASGIIAEPKGPSPLTSMLFPDSYLRSFLRKHSPANDAERLALGRTWLLYSVLVCASHRYWDDQYVTEAIAKARELGVDRDWVSEAFRELDRDVLDPAYRAWLAAILPEIERAGPGPTRALGEAVAGRGGGILPRERLPALPDRARQNLLALAREVAPGLVASLESGGPRLSAAR